MNEASRSAKNLQPAPKFCRLAVDKLILNKNPQNDQKSGFMKEQQELTLETSSEYLRLALPLLSKHRIPVTPQNFTVWFDYVAGRSAALSEIIDNLIAAEAPINEDVTRDLYERFYGDKTQMGVVAAQERVEQILSMLLTSLSKADDEALKYEQALSKCSEDLNEDVSVEQLGDIVSRLVQDTHQMTESSHSLHDYLEESKKEADELRMELEKVRAEAKTDPLTGLLNRKGLSLEIEQLQAEPDYEKQQHALLIGDIDRFKSINDNYGHLFGDKVIKIVATALTKITKGKDLVARFGGEEFVVILPDTDVGGAQAVAESIRTSLEKGRVFNPKTKEEIERITISLGVTPLAPGENLDGAIGRADAALYRAKENGRNRVELEMGDLPQAAAM